MLRDCLARKGWFRVLSCDLFKVFGKLVLFQLRRVSEPAEPGIRTCAAKKLVKRVQSVRIVLCLQSVPHDPFSIPKVTILISFDGWNANHPQMVVNGIGFTT